MMKILGLLTSLLISTALFGQTELFKKSNNYTRQDSLRGSITPERAWWDLKYYDMYVSVDPEERFISGSNTITYDVLATGDVMQIDLQEPMILTKAEQDGSELEIRKEGNAHFIKLQQQDSGTTNKVTFFFEGNPLVAKRAPWDGGFSWKTDDNGKHFIATSNQGIGASIWWPCKDHMYDEPDLGMTLRINAPKGLKAVGNGRLEGVKKEKNGTSTYTWKVVNPINNYGVNVNIGDYKSFSYTYAGEKGDLDVEHWVLSYNLKKAKEHFKQADMTLEAFEHWFGPYPFYEDSYKLVEVPYLGMEHQSSVTYGNQYGNGYLGSDRTGTGWGLKFDYIIIHETGHEWFANNITYKDAADMWVHEGFTCYSEGLYVEYFHGKDAGAEYLRGLRPGINNQKAVIGDYHVNNEGSKDMYDKGANLLHTVRQVVNDDEKWRQILRGLNEEFYHATVTTKQVEEYISKESGINLTSTFDQYLRDSRLPVLEYFFIENSFFFRWTNCIDTFTMPLKVKIAGKDVWLRPNPGYQQLEVESTDITFDPDFYVYTSRVR